MEITDKIDTSAVSKGLKRHVLPILVLFLVCLVTSGYYLYSAYAQAGRLVAMLDDTYIHLQFARNLASGFGFSFNPGTWVSGSTSPLWVFFLAAFYHLVPNLEFFSIGLSAFFYFCSVIALYFLVIRAGLSRFEAFLASFFLALNGSFCWISFSGMETSLMAFLILGFPALLQIDKQGPSLASSLFLTLLLWARPEGALLGFIFWLRFYVWDFYLGRVSARDFWLYNLVLCFGFFPYFGANYLMGGHPFPNTYYAKAACKRAITLFASLKYGFHSLLLFLEWSPLYFLALTCFLPALKRDSPLRFALPLFFFLPFAQMFYYPWDDQAGRYLLPMLPLMMFLGAVGLRQFLQGGFAFFRGRPLKKRYLTLASPFVFTLFYWVQNWSQTFAFSCKNIHTMHFSIVNWLKNNCPSGSRVATGDIGIIRWFGSSSVLDINGLVTPELVKLWRGGAPFEIAIFQLLRRHRPRYSVAFIKWFPFFEGFNGMKEVFRVHVPEKDNYILGGENMVIFQMDYESKKGSWLSYLKNWERKNRQE